MTGLCHTASFLRLLISPLLFFCVNVILAFIFSPKLETSQKLALQNIMTNRQRMLPLLFHCGTPESITGHARCLVCKSSQWNTCPQCNLSACSNFHFFSFSWTCLKNYLKAPNVSPADSGLRQWPGRTGSHDRRHGVQWVEGHQPGILSHHSDLGSPGSVEQLCWKCHRSCALQTTPYHPPAAR